MCLKQLHNYWGISWTVSAHLSLFNKQSYKFIICSVFLNSLRLKNVFVLPLKVCSIWKKQSELNNSLSLWEHNNWGFFFFTEEPVNRGSICTDLLYLIIVSYFKQIDFLLAIRNFWPLLSCKFTSCLVLSKPGSLKLLKVITFIGDNDTFDTQTCSVTCMWTMIW